MLTLQPFEKIFKSCLNQGIFPAALNKANVQSVYEKRDHRCVKKYKLVSLLPVFSKIFERLIYSATSKHFLDMFKDFLDNNLTSSKQSGFKPADSCIDQLIAITHDIFEGFDDGIEVRGFFDIS